MLTQPDQRLRCQQRKMQRKLTGIVVTFLFLVALSAPVDAQEEGNGAEPKGSITIYVGNLNYNVMEDELGAYRTQICSDLSPAKESPEGFEDAPRER